MQKGAVWPTFSSTHGALDNLNSDGMVLSNFTPTRDTSSDRVAGQFNDFSDVRNFRAEESGAELVTRNEQALARIPHDPFDRDYRELASDAVYLRIWSPQWVHLSLSAPVEVTIEKVNHFPNPQNQRRVPRPGAALGRHLTFNQPVPFSVPSPYERVYALPSDLILKPLAEYRISGWIRGQGKSLNLFEFNFYTDHQGRPAAY